MSDQQLKNPYHRPQPQQMLDAREFVNNLPLIMARAGALGLFKTQHALHAAVQVSGYELAEKIEKQTGGD